MSHLNVDIAKTTLAKQPRMGSCLKRKSYERLSQTYTIVQTCRGKNILSWHDFTHSKTPLNVSD